MEQEKRVLDQYTYFFGNLPLFYACSTMAALMAILGIQVLFETIHHPSFWGKWILMAGIAAVFCKWLHRHHQLKKKMYDTYQEAYQKWIWYQHHKAYRHGLSRIKENDIITILSYGYTYDSYQNREMMRVKGMNKFGQLRFFYTEEVEFVQAMLPKTKCLISFRETICYRLEVIK